MATTEANAVPGIGELAPDFTLPSTSGDKVTLSSLKGNPVLIAFFPLAFSGTCTAELCAMRDDYEQFAHKGVLILPISVDSTYSLKEYKNKHSLKHDLLSDFTRVVSQRYGVLIDEKQYANRAYFLIDRDGIVRWAHVEDNPGQRRENTELLAAIDAVGG